jgi:hypothetical protein
MIKQKPSRRLEELTREHGGVADIAIVKKCPDVLDRLGDSRA